MSKPLKNRIEQLRVAAASEADQRIRRAVDRAWNEYRHTKEKSAPAPVWRMIMNKKVTVFALAAVLVAAVMIGVFPSGPAQPLWADIIKPVMQAQNAELTIIVGEPGSGPEIRDQVLGSRLRRTVAGIDAVSIIDLETSKILSLEPNTKTATLIDMQNLPKIPNYMERLRNLLTKLEAQPHFEIEYLGRQTLDNGREVLAMNVTYEGGYIFMAIDPQTYAPVQIDQIEGQMKILCRDIRFDVEMDESLFSMDVPEGYTMQQTQLDLSSGTEANFIEGLRLWTQYIGDGYFPEDVRVESYIQAAPQIGKRIEASGLPQEEQMKIGMSMGSYLLFIRFYRGDGPWTYAGRGVPFGDPATPIFWYKPDKAEPYHVIYADLHVEKVADEATLPPAPEPYDAVPAYSPSRAFGGIAADAEIATWHIQPGGRVEVHSEIALTVPEDAPAIPIMLPYPQGELSSVLLDGQIVPFTSPAEGRYEIPVMEDGGLKLLCVWNLPLDALEKNEAMFRIELKPLIPAARFELHAVLEENSGYVFTDSPDQRQMTLFTVEASAPDAHFGSCGLPISPIQ